jgi:DNA-binding HxlR family transcriptional regulator
MPRITTPLPGRKVRGSTTGRPIMALLDLLGRRWSLRILWELHAGAQNFRELQALCDDMSPSVLNKRLAELRDARIVEHADEGYVLTTSGRDLLRAFKPLNDWSKRWGRRA